MPYIINDPQIGGAAVSDFQSIPNAVFTTTGNLPFVNWPPLGYVSRGVSNDTLNNVTASNPGYPQGTWGEFIYLVVPTSTAVTAGLMYTWDSRFQIAVNPNTASTGRKVAVALQSFASDANNVRFAWFQISGKATILKEAAAVTPDSALFVSTTTGRIRTTSSTGRQLLGMRSANQATVAAGTSSVLVWMDRPLVSGV